jgi:hypothetical protein
MNISDSAEGQLRKILNYWGWQLKKHECSSRLPSQSVRVSQALIQCGIWICSRRLLGRGVAVVERVQEQAELAEQQAWLLPNITFIAFHIGSVVCVSGSRRAEYALLCARGGFPAADGFDPPISPRSYH